MRLRLIFILSVITIGFQVVGQDVNQQSVKIMSFNVQHGANIHGEFELNWAINLINSSRPNIVTLQEVDRNTRISYNTDVATELGMQTNMTSVFGQAINYSMGEYGVAVLTKYPILKSEVHKLPSTNDIEPKVALEVILKLPMGDTIRVVNAHLTMESDSIRLSQLAYLHKHFDDGVSTLLAGNLNTIPDSKEIKTHFKNWKMSTKETLYTYPSEAPNVKIDYVFSIPKNKWEVKQATVIDDMETSDHLPLLVLFNYLPNK